MQELQISRFPAGRDYGAEEPEAWAVCEGCGYDIYDDAIEMPDGGIVHDEMDCVMRYPGVKRRVG